MTLISADEARAQVPSKRMAKVNKAIRYAIKEGQWNCFVRFGLKEHEQQAWVSLGYDVKVDGGITFLYWFPAKEGAS